MALQNIHHGSVRYSQTSIERTFSDRRTSVETWMSNLPYTLPLEIASVDGEYLSLDNRRLYSAKKHSLNETVSCIVHQLSDPPTELMQDHGLDCLEILWADKTTNSLRRLSLRANTIEGVMMIRCVTQNTSFPILGRLDPAPLVGERIYDPVIWKKSPASIGFAQLNDDYLENMQAAEMILVCVKPNFNIYHRRDDLRDVLISRPELFQLIRYERSTGPVMMKTRGENKPDTWDDDWDDLLCGLSEAESLDRDLYEIAG